MKVSIVQENLNKALNTVSRVVGSRTSLPVLANVLLTTEASRLVVSATNLEVAISYSVGCKTEKEGSVTAPARLFAELISSMPSDKIQLTSAGDNLSIKTTNFESSLNGIAVSEFPTTPQVKPEAEFTIPSPVLLEGLSEVVVAASLDESRPVLAGVAMIVADGQLTLAATDSYRLAEKKLPLPSVKDITVIVPAKTVQELNRIIHDSSDDVRIAISKTEVLFEVGDVSLVSRLIEGKFPNYQQIIPTKSATSLTLKKSELMSIVKVASLFARENSHTIKLNFTKVGLSISSKASEVGENTSLVEGELTGEEAEISVNAKYLADVLNILSTNEVFLGINDKLEPCMIRAINKGKVQPDYTHIIMPLRS